MEEENSSTSKNTIQRKPLRRIVGNPGDWPEYEPGQKTNTIVKK